MNKVNFTQYDVFPEAMVAYMRNYGPHFNKKLFNFAISKMKKRGKNGMQTIQPISREELKQMMSNNGVTLENDQLYDSAYVANMCKADFLNSSVIDDLHLLYYVRDVIDDPDAADGLVFNRWYADMCYMGIAIDWEEML